MNQPRRTIRRSAVVAKTGLSQSTIYYAEKAGNFPPHFMLTPRCAVWFEDEVDEWLVSRRAESASLTALPSRKFRSGKERAA
ncbi:MAG: helix-turn-helix transcriptional regulator [Rhizobacter sp.]